MKYTYGHGLGGGATSGIRSNAYRHGGLDRIGASWIHSLRRTEAIEAGNNMTDHSVDSRSSGLDNHQKNLLPQMGFCS
jgi:antibiotic biosynthesis monooxygenase (ABM) superfamily enzyme